MRIELIPNKKPFYIRLLVRLKQEEESIHKHSWKGFIPYATIYKKICGCFSLPKEELREELNILEKFEFIERVGFVGIKLNYKIEGREEDE